MRSLDSARADIDAAREKAVMIQGQVRRGGRRERKLQKKLADSMGREAISRDQLVEVRAQLSALTQSHQEQMLAADDEIANLKVKLKCAEGARDVLQKHSDSETAAKEASTLRKTVDVTSTPSTATEIPLAERVAVRQVIEDLIVGKTAEALRRRGAEHLTMGISVYSALLHGSTSDEIRTCTCLKDADDGFARALTLPQMKDSDELCAATAQILDTMREGGIVSLHDYHLDRYNQSAGEDRKEVEKAQTEGRANPTSWSVLTANACHYPRVTAERKLREACPSLPLPSASMRAPSLQAVPATESVFKVPLAVPLRTSTPMEVTPSSEEKKTSEVEASGESSDSSGQPDLEVNSLAEDSERE